jgi:tRNA pseudouridine38-40 synthase
MPTLRLTVEYEGTRYHGWQEQANAPRTVAGELRAAIEKTGARVLELGGSGRTDRGVHALAQVAHVRLTTKVDIRRLRDGVNEALPHDIHLLDASPASDRFHSRHDAVSRSYLYQISRRRTAFGRRFVWWVKEPLDLAAMSQAAELLRGRHDFERFCEAPSKQTSTLVVVENVEIAESGALVLVRLTASHFLWKMVRRVVGALARAGAGRLSPAQLARLLEGGPPRGADDPGHVAEWTAPASGLFLERVLYPGDAAPTGLVPAFPVGPEPATSSPQPSDRVPPSGSSASRRQTPRRRGSFSRKGRP